MQGFGGRPSGHGTGLLGSARKGLADMISVARQLVACAAFCAAFVAPASAQQASSDMFTVAGVRVDQSAANATQARTLALAQAQRSGFERVAQRLTTPADQGRLTLPRPDDATLDRLVRGVDVEEQRQSGTRYLGRFAVRFDPAGVTSLLQGAGFTVLDRRGAPTLIVPQFPQAAAPGPGVGAPVVDPWRQAWEQGGFGREVLPLLIAPNTVVGPADWPTAAAAASSAGAASAIFAVARSSGASLTADLVETAPGGVRVNRGQVSVPIQGGDAGVPDAFRRLADSANARLQAEFKSRAPALAAERRKLQVSALYRDMAEWTRIKEGLGQAGAAISEIRIEAIARDGAIVSFTHAGSPEDVAVALQRYGLLLSSTPIGPTLRAAPR